MHESRSDKKVTKRPFILPRHLIFNSIKIRDLGTSTTPLFVLLASGGCCRLLETKISLSSPSLLLMPQFRGYSADTDSQELGLSFEHCYNLAASQLR